MTKPTRRLDRHLVVLCAVLLLAAGFRFHGLDWDVGQHQHPDERHISTVMLDRLFIPPRHDLAGLLDPATSDLNPRSNEPGTNRPRQFAYGSLPLLLTEGVSCLLEVVSGHVCRPDGPGTRYWTTYQGQYLVGRALTVLADLALIVVTFLLARRAFGATAGLIAAALLAVSVVNIQLAHFFATDTWSALFATAALWGLYRAADKGPFASWADWALAGALAGASVASKPNTMSLAVPALAALWFSLRGEMSDWLPLALRRGLMLGGATILSFAVLEPYALPTLGTYLRDFNEQAAIIGGSADVPYTRQIAGGPGRRRLARLAAAQRHRRAVAGLVPLLRPAHQHRLRQVPALHAAPHPRAGHPWRRAGRRAAAPGAGPPAAAPAIQLATGDCLLATGPRRAGAAKRAAPGAGLR
jgi:hypothetical protein